MLTEYSNTAAGTSTFQGPSEEQAEEAIASGTAKTPSESIGPLVKFISLAPRGSSSRLELGCHSAPKYLTICSALIFILMEATSGARSNRGRERERDQTSRLSVSTARVHEA